MGLGAAACGRHTWALVRSIRYIPEHIGYRLADAPGSPPCFVSNDAAIHGWKDGLLANLWLPLSLGREFMYRISHLRARKIRQPVPAQTGARPNIAKTL